ncbi:hypothetical protein EZS27_028991 [termite gut metagenome]|uniref:Uncharacterized protein n=1 Tax=termite gut metagenome TaxID=433724 RepID=A0A5J4QJY5_9ZZZZ
MTEKEKLEMNLFSIDIEYSAKEVSNALSKPEEGLLAFNDGVFKTTVKVKLTVRSIAKETAVLFYLSPKGDGSNAATKMELNLRLSNHSISMISFPKRLTDLLSPLFFSIHCANGLKP